VTDKAFWPKDRTLWMFDKWFEVQMGSLVQDLDSDTALQLIRLKSHAGVSPGTVSTEFSDRMRGSGRARIRDNFVGERSLWSVLDPY